MKQDQESAPKFEIFSLLSNSETAIKNRRDLIQHYKIERKKHFENDEVNNDNTANGEAQ